MLNQEALVAFLQTDEAAVIAAVIASGVPLDKIRSAAAGGGFAAIVLDDGRLRTRSIGADGKVSGKHGDLPAQLTEWIDRQ